jgi:polysaccharide deacetylase family protein (PEP-CTERM system associated)
LQKAVNVIFKASGIIPIGYRAPSWSINSSLPWAFETLAELGFRYDSSIYPVKHDIYGEPGAPRDIFRMRLTSGKTLYEIPASTIKFLGRNMPVCGGGYLRHSPYWYTSRVIRNLNRADRPAVIYVHPWELDTEQPRTEGLTFFQKFRQYGSVATVKKKLENLLSQFDFIPAGDYVNMFARRKIGFEK